MTELFRVSFSILDPWSRGQYDEAVMRYLRIETPPTPAMEDGKLLHRQWQTETTTTKCLPAVFGKRKLVQPETEVKMTAVIDDWIEFVGVIDCLEPYTIHEYKTGHANSLVYVKTMQTPCYQLLAYKNGYAPEIAMIHHFNQHTQQTTRSKRYLTPQSRELAREWIVTFASELHEALQATNTK